MHNAKRKLHCYIDYDNAFTILHTAIASPQLIACLSLSNNDVFFYKLIKIFQINKFIMDYQN